MTANVIDRTTCRLCGSANLSTALALGPSPLGDDFVTAKELKRPQPEFDVTLMLCLSCGNVQLSQMVNPDLIYKRYTYITSASHGLVTHFERYADSVMGKFSAPGLVVEIGSNEGAMLRHFQRHGWRVLGVDPATEIAKRATIDGILTVAEYFTPGVARQIKQYNGPAQLVIANNVLANIDDLDEIAEGVRELLALDGLFVFETSYLLDVVERGLLDTIFHEHVSYFAVTPLRSFFARHGLEIIDAKRTAPKGGSFRCAVQRAGGPRQVSTNVEALVNVENVAGLDRLETYQRLGNKLGQMKEALQAIVSTFEHNSKPLAAWGAADGGTSMLYYFQLGKYLQYLIDDNLVKIGTFSPGLHLPVMSSAILKHNPPCAIVLLAWRYADEIIKNHWEYDGKWISPLPEVKVL